MCSDNYERVSMLGIVKKYRLNYPVISSIKMLDYFEFIFKKLFIEY